MKVMNADEAVPEIFYIFVNELSPLTKHNFITVGQFTSGAFLGLGDSEFVLKYINGTVRYLPFEPCEMDAMGITPFHMTATCDYRVEYDAEYFREKHAKLFPSRFSAIYAFGDFAICEMVSRKHGWNLNSVKRFKLLPSPFNRVVKVNMEHVSLARHAYRNSSFGNTDGLWQGYWSGAASASVTMPGEGFKTVTHESGTIWEYLIEGAVQHIDR
ncbi:hypothetical protein ABIC63_003407 [Pseudacidovorax sp. 1753]|uniref:hypothetical protein n=1 Tax=Pseudacidovorax sp. 1753 TaxID=3156419 RepID=UPI003397DDA1